MKGARTPQQNPAHRIPTKSRNIILEPGMLPYNNIYLEKKDDCNKKIPTIQKNHRTKAINLNELNYLHLQLEGEVIWVRSCPE